MSFQYCTAVSRLIFVCLVLRFLPGHSGQRATGHTPRRSGDGFGACTRSPPALTFSCALRWHVDMSPKWRCSLPLRAPEPVHSLVSCPPILLPSIRMWATREGMNAAPLQPDRPIQCRCAPQEGGNSGGPVLCVVRRGQTGGGPAVRARGRQAGAINAGARPSSCSPCIPLCCGNSTVLYTLVQGHDTACSIGLCMYGHHCT